MNIAAFVSGPIVDILNVGLNDGIVINGRKWSGNRLVILTASSVCLFSAILTYFFLREVRVSEDGSIVVRDFAPADISSHQQLDGLVGAANPIHIHDNDNHDESINNEAVEVVELSLTSVESNECVAAQAPATQEFTPEHKSLCKTITETVLTMTFVRYSLFTLFLINLRTVFRHLDATMPTYLVRVFGPNVSKGSIYSINPFIIMLLTPVVAAFTSSYAHYDMIKYGGFVSAASPLLLAVSTSIPAAVCFVVVLSLGEAVWSPRTYGKHHSQGETDS